MARVLSLKEIVSDIKKRRKVLGLTQKRLANLAGISQAALARIEKNAVAYNPSYLAIYQISEALDVFSKGQKQTGVESKTVGDVMHKRVVSIKPSESLQKAIELMKGKSFSQLPVIEKGVVVGTVYEKRVAGVAFEGRNPRHVRVEEIIEPALVQIDKSTPLLKAKAVLEQWPAVLVTDRQKLVGIATVYDLLKAV